MERKPNIVFMPWGWPRWVLAFALPICTLLVAYQASMPFGLLAACDNRGVVMEGAYQFYRPAMWMSDHCYPLAKLEQWEWKLIHPNSGGRPGAGWQVELWEAWWQNRPPK